MPDQTSQTNSKQQSPQDEAEWIARLAETAHICGRCKKFAPESELRWCDACCAEVERLQFEADEREREYGVSVRLRNANFPGVIRENRELNVDERYRHIAASVIAVINGTGKPWSLLTGPVGTTKTFVTCKIVERYIRHGGRALYTTFADLLLQIRDTYKSHSNLSELDVLKQYRETPLLVLDDLGVEKPSEFTASTLFQVLDHRYHNAQKTILITNYKPSNLAARLAVGDETTGAARIVDRITELAEWTEVTGPSIRPELAKIERDFSYAPDGGRPFPNRPEGLQGVEL